MLNKLSVEITVYSDVRVLTCVPWMNLALKLCSTEGVTPYGCHAMGACHLLTAMRNYRF